MTESFGIFDRSDSDSGDDYKYAASIISGIIAKFLRDGVVHGDGGELAVSASDPPAMSVRVGTGTALLQGRYYRNDAALPLAIATADPSNPRIDRVVLRLNATPGRTIHAVVVQGTPAPSPVAPALTRTAETWDLALAQVRVEAGVTSIASAKIIDERGDPSLCGWAVPSWVPSSQIEVTGDLSAAGHRITGLGAPSAAADAATKGYADAEIAAKIGGFSLDDVVIVDRDWDGKVITNPVIYATDGSVAASDTVLASPLISSTGMHSYRAAYTIPRGWRGAVRAKLTFHTNMNPGKGTGFVRLNGAGVYSYYIDTPDTTHSGTVDLPAVSEGDVIEIGMDGGDLDAATICGTTGATTRQIGGTPAGW